MKVYLRQRQVFFEEVHGDDELYLVVGILLQTAPLNSGVACVPFFDDSFDLLVSVLHDGFFSLEVY